MYEVIYKYRLGTRAVGHIEMPAKSQLLHVGVQDGEVYVWAKVTPTNPNTERQIYVAETGMSLAHIPHGVKYVGTFMLYDGQYVGHVFG